MKTIISDVSNIQVHTLTSLDNKLLRLLIK